MAVSHHDDDDFISLQKYCTDDRQVPARMASNLMGTKKNKEISYLMVEWNG